MRATVAGAGSAPGVDEAAQGRLRAAWTEVHGPLNDAAELLLAEHPDYFSLVLDFTAHAWRRGPLEPRIKALILLAVDAAPSHLNATGAALNVRRALALGASRAEVLETLELTSTMGIHAAKTPACRSCSRSLPRPASRSISTPH